MPERPVYTAAQIRAAEAPLLRRGVPLMARAAHALATSIRREGVRREGVSHDGRVLVLAGAGDNGGDALLAAAELAQDGAAVDVVLTSERFHEQGLAAAEAAGARVVDIDDAVRSAGGSPGYAVIIDGILGIGADPRGGLRGRARDTVAALLPHVRQGRAAVVAVDLPSGLHPDDGTAADDLVLPAAVTVTFGGVKAGLVRDRGPRLAGRTVLVELGLTLPDAGAAEAVEVEIFSQPGGPHAD
jgi:NAD(P)H-hydrate epimerase